MSGRSPRTNVGVARRPRHRVAQPVRHRPGHARPADHRRTCESYKPTDRLELSTRASHVRTGDLKHYYSTIAVSDQGGGAARWIVTPSLHLVGDGGVVVLSAQRRRRPRARWIGSRRCESPTAARLGTDQCVAILARRSADPEPAPDGPPERLFVAGEFDAFARLRVFGGWEAFRLEPRPDAGAASVRTAPASVGTTRLRRRQNAGRRRLERRLSDRNR